MSELNRDKILPNASVMETSEEVDPIVGSTSRTESFTLSEYLQGVSELLTESAMRVILAKRGLNPDTEVSELTEKELDLAEAEVYYMLCNLPVGGATTKDVDGTWSHSEGGWTVSGANIEEWWRKYTWLREKWGQKVIAKSTIRVHSRGMRVWRKF